MDVIILHAWKPSFDSAHKWYTPLVSCLEKRGYKVYVPDLPGFGTSHKPAYAFSLQDYVWWIISYMKKNKLKNPIIIGHSFGGRVALNLVLDKSYQWKMLVLTGVPGFPSASKNKIAFFRIVAKISNLIFLFPPLSSISDIARKLFYRLIGVQDYYYSRGIMRETFKQIISENLEVIMKKITVKTILIWGKNDRITPIWIGEKMQKAIKNSQLIVIPRASHLVAINQPYEFVDAIGTIRKDFKKV